jgi:hypothetical protein
VCEWRNGLDWGIAAVGQASTITWVGLQEGNSKIIPLSLEPVEFGKVTCRGPGGLGRGGGRGGRRGRGGGRRGGGIERKEML